MKILKIIHGYPPLYNAGSEVYSQLLCLGLSAQHHEVHVFTREENPFADDFSIRKSCDHLDNRIRLHIINIPQEKYRYRYSLEAVDKQLDQLLTEIKPDVVHIGHLNHVSTSLVFSVVKHNIPIVYTLHDYWIMCPRGQFIQRNSQNQLWALCNGQEDKKCASQCYSGYFSGINKQIEADANYWTKWVSQRMQHMHDIEKCVDLFIAPSKYLYQRYVDQFRIDPKKLVYLDYGFDLNRFEGRLKKNDEVFTFGYIGTHIPAKGIQHLIEAFGMLSGHSCLKIWGRHRHQNTEGLKLIASKQTTEVQERITWHSEYRNELIVEDVFNHVDCIVVPSIWVENSPLVIHEALQARVLVITADEGGMAEYIHHAQNGLLFEHRNPNSLAEQMQWAIDHKKEAKQLAQRGYIQSQDGNIPDLETHVSCVTDLYRQLID